jgi:hypothetical protein
VGGVGVEGGAFFLLEAILGIKGFWLFCSVPLPSFFSVDADAGAVSLCGVKRSGLANEDATTPTVMK